MKIRLNPKYQKYEPFVRELTERFEHEGETIYTGRNLIKVMTMADGSRLNVKRYHAPRGINALVYSLGLRKPKGVRAFEYPALLLERGIETPEPIAYVEQRRCGFLRECYLVTVQCSYAHTMYEVGNAPAGTYEALAEALGRFAAHMHDRRVMHRDFSPGNILWQEDGGYHFSIVDINRMYFGTVSLRQGCANLKRLWGPKRFFQLVVRHYAEARGFDPAEAEALALKERAAFWRRFSKKHRVKFELEL